MRKTILVIFALSILSSLTMAQSYNYRYWIDNNVAGAATGSATGEKNFEVDISSLSTGIHALRLQAAKGSRWSSVHTHYFVKTGRAASSARYWFDNDPSTMHEGVATSGNIELDISRLTVGLHAVHYQLLSSEGPSVVRTRYFLINEVQLGNYTAQVSIDNGEPTTYQVSSEVIEIGIEDIPAGTHHVHVAIYDVKENIVYETTQEFVTKEEEEEPAEIEVTDISELSDAVYIEPVTALVGNEVEVNICLKNAQQATAYLFDLELPDGITVAKNANDKYIDALSDRHDDHMRTFNYRGDGVYAFSTLSGNSEPLAGNDGPIRIVTLKIDESVVAGDYKLQIKNASYSELDGTLVKMPDTVSKITVEDYILGDANGNGGLDIGDAVSVVNYLVGKPSSNFIEAASDTNKNGQIDIGDAVTIVNILVGKITGSSAPELTETEEIREPQ